jgi:hypothetical protein
MNVEMSELGVHSLFGFRLRLSSARRAVGASQVLPHTA